MNKEYEAVTEFSQWYEGYNPDGGRGDGCLEFKNLAKCATYFKKRFEDFRREMDQRTEGYDQLELLADAKVHKEHADLPNISSGETAGMVRRLARNLVQHTPNVEVISKFDDETKEGIIARYLLTSKIIGDDLYSNNMQQNLFASTKAAITVGYDAVIPTLVQNGNGTWCMHYDSLHYRDVFPDPGAKDVRQSSDVFVRRHLTKGDVKALIRNNVAGWDIAALKLMLKTPPPSRRHESNSLQQKTHRQLPDGYEIITWYSNTGEPFLTFDERYNLLLRIEKNKHPAKEHPVFFLVLEKDDQQPLGKSQVELIFGRQNFQDLMLNGSMKLWYRNINPPLIGYGVVNAIPNLSPGKYTQISNPNARIEPFEVNTQTLLQYGSISQMNQGAMIGMIGAADQQMASTGVYDSMSATPQGVEQQQQMVDITTNNYQKAIEHFFSQYCSYALTVYFQELKGVKEVVVNADTRLKMLNAGAKEDWFDDEGRMEADFQDLATQYWVRCVPGSLVEMEDEKQIRILKELFVPLSQAMPAMAATQDQQILGQAAAAMEYIIFKMISLSGSDHAKNITSLWSGKETKEQVSERDQRIDDAAASVGLLRAERDEEMDMVSSTFERMQQQITILAQNQQILLEKLGVLSPQSESSTNTSEGRSLTSSQEPANVAGVRA